MRYRYELKCPRCGKTTEQTTENKTDPPRISCGDCLMNDVEVVEFKVVRVEVLP
jgi:endogenous inhibitor of DNA gyrase (YacG/DUF329 family)